MTQFLKSRYTGALILAVFFGGFLITQSYRKTGSSNVGTVSRGDLTQRVTISGTITPNHKTVIATPYNGYIRKMFVQVGEQVKSGDPIVSVAQSLRGSGEDVYP